MVKFLDVQSHDLLFTRSVFLWEAADMAHQGHGLWL